MIAAGTLKYKLTFKQRIKEQDNFGSIKESKNILFSCKAAKMKSTGKFELNAKELFHTNTLTFKIRDNKLFNDGLIVEYDGDEYTITSSDKNLFDNSIVITIEKINS